MTRNASNNAPKIQWIGQTMACGTHRQRLYVNSQETPYFVDSAATIGHRTQGDKHGLFGAGMGNVVRTRDGGSYRIAATLASAPKVAVLKHKAEQYALAT